MMKQFFAENGLLVDLSTYKKYMLFWCKYQQRGNVNMIIFLWTLSDFYSFFPSNPTVPHSARVEGKPQFGKPDQVQWCLVRISLEKWKLWN